MLSNLYDFLFSVEYIHWIDSARMNESLMNQISVYFELHDLEKDSEVI